MSTILQDIFFLLGIAISSDNQIYIADGTTIRMVDEDGLIQTLIGSQGQSSRSWKPIGCHGTSRLEDVSLRWPSDLAISPLDNSLHFIDDSYVLKITKDNQVEIVAGRPLHCHSSLDRDLASFAAKTSLVSPQALSFFGNGDIYLAESDGQRVNRINRITTDGRLELFAGRESKCNCQDPECPCFDETVLLASDTVFGSISRYVIYIDLTNFFLIFIWMCFYFTSFFPLQFGSKSGWFHNCFGSSQ